MNSVHINELKDGDHLNYNGDIITVIQAKQFIAAGLNPTLYTVTKNLIPTAYANESTELYLAADPNVKRVIYN